MFESISSNITLFRQESGSHTDSCVFHNVVLPVAAVFSTFEMALHAIPDAVVNHEANVGQDAALGGSNISSAEVMATSAIFR